MQNRQNYSQLPGNLKVPSARTLPARPAGRGRGRGNTRLVAKDTKTETTPVKERENSIPEVFKAFSTRFVRLNGILFTRTRYQLIICLSFINISLPARSYVNIRSPTKSEFA